MSVAGLARYEAALEAACGRAGLDARDAVVLHVRANAVYHLPREGVVARVRFAPGDPGAVVERFTAAIRVTRWLRDQRFPAPEPVDLDQPVSVAGHVVSFWKYVTVTGEGRDAVALGQLIRRLHDLPPPAVPLPAANLLGSLRADLENSGAVTADERCWLLARAGELEEQYRQARSVLGAGLVHGDAHAGNLLHASAGVVLGDWDSVCYGPRELDLVPTSLWWRFGRPEAEWDRFCAAYGVSTAGLTALPLLQRFRELRGLAAYVRNAGEPAFRTELSKRIATLRTGDQAQPWRAL